MSRSARRAAVDSTDLCCFPRYLRALAAYYVRLTFDPVNVYEVLEPLLDDYRKIRFRRMGESTSCIALSFAKADYSTRAL